MKLHKVFYYRSAGKVICFYGKKKNHLLAFPHHLPLTLARYLFDFPLLKFLIKNCVFSCSFLV